MPTEPNFTHLDAAGRARMVDVAAKEATERVAVARAEVIMRPETLEALRAGRVSKGDVLAVAQVAGIMAAKRTHELIPMCHPIPLSSVGISFEIDSSRSAVEVEAMAKAVAPTGVEMEALTAVTVAALTIYDMCKALEKGIRISNVRLVRKMGGKSGDVILE
jgi:cyclic pyranopterin phosphate synthase